MEKFRVIIAGGRDFDDYEQLCCKLDFLLHRVKTTRKIIIVCGKARGADTLGERYAIEHGFAVDMYPAQWDIHGKSAGYKRNAVMAGHADALVAFWDGASKGTKHMIDLATQKGLKVRIVRYQKKPQKV